MKRKTNTKRKTKTKTDRESIAIVKSLRAASYQKKAQSMFAMDAPDTS